MIGWLFCLCFFPFSTIVSSLSLSRLAETLLGFLETLVAVRVGHLRHYLDFKRQVAANKRKERRNGGISVTTM